MSNLVYLVTYVDVGYHIKICHSIEELKNFLVFAPEQYFQELKIDECLLEVD